MGAILLALGASVAWGASDFLGGVAAREVRLILVVAGSQLFGLIVFAPILMLYGEPMPSDSRLLLGLLAGVLSAAALGLIYFALRRGPTIVMATIASLGAVLPVVVGVAGGDTLDLAIATGLLCALTGAVGASWESGGERPPRRQVLIGWAIAVTAAVGAGTLLTLVQVSSKADATWTVAAVRLGGALSAVLGLLAAYLIRRRRSSGAARGSELEGVTRGVATAIAAIGAADVAADLAYTNATRSGPLSIVAVIASMYPVSTIALGMIALRERPSPVKLAGAALAGVGVAILAASAP